MRADCPSEWVRQFFRFGAVQMQQLWQMLEQVQCDTWVQFALAGDGHDAQCALLPLQRGQQQLHEVKVPNEVHTCSAAHNQSHLPGC